ncbi:MAG: DUF2089 family protein [Verrucomicrobia bacterium]|nr:DUF2089 family protein [Verrucomicrobiota bacterium]
MDISNAKCPECGKPMTPVVCMCGRCNVRLEGEFEVSPLARLSSEDQALAIAFIRSYGSIKALQESLGVSYPTARNRLETLVAQLDKAMAPPKNPGADFGRSLADEIRRGLEPLRNMREQLHRGLEPLRHAGRHIHTDIRKNVGIHLKGQPEEQEERAQQVNEVLRKLESGEINIKQALEEL